MSSGCDEIEKNVNTIVAETRVTLDTGLLCKNIIVLSFKEANDLAEAMPPSAKSCELCMQVYPTLPHYQFGHQSQVYQQL